MTRYLLFVAIAALFAGCAIQTDDEPRVIPEEEQSSFGEAPQGDIAAGSNRIYLLTPTDPGGQQQVRAVQRDVGSQPRQLLDSLLLGPNAEEQEEGLGTALPADLEVLSTRTVGRVLTVDLSDAFGDLTTDALALVGAQIVITVTQLDSVESVRLLVNGENQVWPLGGGGLAERPLTEYDYPGLVESTQPAYPAIPSRAN